MATWAVWLVIVIGLIGAAAVAILCSRIRVQLVLTRIQNNDRITIVVRALFGLIRYRMHIPMIDFRNLSDGLMLKKKTDNSWRRESGSSEHVHLTRERILEYYERMKQLLRSVYNLLEWTKETLSRLECTHFVWNTRLGVGDAPETAVATGLVWGVKSSLLALVFGRICLKTQPNVQVWPQYNMETFTSELNCKLQIRVGLVAVAMLRLIPHVWKGKGDWETWKNILTGPRLKSTS